MHYHHYKLRDYAFAERLLDLRKRAALTQKKVAHHVGVTEKAIRNWESGSHYPNEANLQKLIELFFAQDAFAPGQEGEEAHTLWEQVRQGTSHRLSSFDEQWFVTVLKLWQTQSSSHSLPSSPREPGDWSAMLDVSTFYGRDNELALLSRWLLIDQCRLVALLGMGGIGKTMLVAKIVQQVAPHFDCVLWRSLHNAPPLDELLRDWIPALSEQRSTPLPQELDQSLALLIKLLQERRCLLVLDNLETLFQTSVVEGGYRQGYEGYAMLIRRVAETGHQSCLLLTCRERFLELGILTSHQAPGRVLRLTGLDVVASQQLLHDKGLFGQEGAWNELVQRYAGNPLALKIVAETMYELFGGDIAAFLDEGPMTFHGIRQLLKEQFERLSSLEQELMYWLAIERELVTLEVLRQDLWRPVSKREMMEALQALRNRSLIERGEQGAVFTLQPVVLEYVSELLVALVSEEIHERKPVLLLKYGLLQGRAKDYIRASQASLILQPLLDRLLSTLGSREKLEEHFERLLEEMRAMPEARQSYGGGNVVNLLVRLAGQIQSKNCSGLAIWQADLQEAEIHETSFVGCDLTGSAFKETNNGITSVALSANGQYVAGGSNNGKIYVWRTTDGQPLLVLSGHSRQVWSLAFHPAGRLLISGGYDGLVKVWEVSSGTCVSTLQGHTKWIGSVAVHPAGRLVATASDDGSIRLWDLQANCCLKVWHEQHSEIWSVVFSPDGRRLSSGDNDGVVKLWDLESPQCLWSSVVHPGSPVPSLAFSPDGELLVSAGYDGALTMWEADSGERRGTLFGHTDVVYSVTFNADGLLASGSRDRSVKLWQVGERGAGVQCLCMLQGHNGWIWSTILGPAGLLASGSDDGVVKLWQVSRSGEEGKCLRTLRGYSRLVNSVALSPDGEILVGGERNGTVRMWETKSGKTLHTLAKQAGGAFSVATIAFHPDGQRFATSSPEHEITIWDVESGRCLRTLQGHQEEIWSVAFSPDGHFLVSCSSDRTLKWWEVGSGHCLNTLRGHRDWIWSVAFSPDGRLLASGDGDGVVKLWETSNQQCVKTLHGSPRAIMALSFTPESTRLLSSNEQDLVTVWDVQSGACLGSMPGIGEVYWLHSVAFSPDGSLLLAAGSDQTIKLWNVSSGQLLRTFPCPTGQPWPVALSADMRLLVCGTDEGTIVLWERQTGQCLLTLRSDRPYEHMNISGVTGITEAQRACLKALGANEG